MVAFLGLVSVMFWGFLYLIFNTSFLQGKLIMNTYEPTNKTETLNTDIYIMYVISL